MMHDEYDELGTFLKRWKVEVPPADLARRIAGEATRRPQQLPWSRRLARSMEQWLTEWRYGLALKAGALAVCVLAGLAVGQVSGPGAQAEPDVLAIAFAQDVWMSQL